jgi:hypothetical protein
MAAPPLDPLRPEPPRRDPFEELETEELDALDAGDAEGGVDRAEIRAVLPMLFSVGGITRPTDGRVEVVPP